MATYQVNTLVNNAATLLQDPTNVRWPTAELIQWLNDGQREIAAIKPNAFVVNATVPCTSGSKQTLPAAGISLIDVVRNNASGGASPGNAIRVVSREVLDAQIPDWHTPAKAAATVKHYMYTPLDPKTFWVYPPSTGSNYVDIIYVASPTDAAAGGTITIDDVYAATLLNYIMYRAYSKDAEYAANAGLAKAYYDAFQSQLGQKVAAEAVSNPNAGLGNFNPNIPASNK